MSTCRRLATVVLLALGFLHARALERIARQPYIGAIVTDAATGQVLFEDKADARGYPASITKLMTFAVVMDKVDAGQLALDTPVTVTAEAAKIGGSQIFLKQGEVFTVDELLYALMIQSANDAAEALAIRAAGSSAAFVELMNARARTLGMTNSDFHSPHGLPPDAKKGQKPDATSARDLALLSADLLKHGRILHYTSVKERTIREKTKPFVMRNHNDLLGIVPGCDGLKTGYYYAAGCSLVATAERNGRRIIAVVLGSEHRGPRDTQARELLERGFAALPAAAPPVAKAAAPAAAPFRDPDTIVTTVKTDKSAAAPTDQSSTPADTGITFRVIPPPKKP